MNNRPSIPLFLAPAFVLAAGSGNQEGAAAPACQPLSAGAALVRAAEVLADVSGDTVFAVRSVLSEVHTSAEGVEQVSLTLQLSIFAPHEIVARQALEQLGRRIADRPWRGEDESPAYPRWASVFHSGSSSGYWTPGHEHLDLDAAGAVEGLVTFVFDSRDLCTTRLPTRTAREGSDGLQTFAREKAAHSKVAFGQLEFTHESRTPSPDFEERVLGIRPVRALGQMKASPQRFVRGQIGNFLYLLDSSDDELGRVTRVELRPIGTGSNDMWTFQLDFSTRELIPPEDPGR